jgi:hypothetical protein
VELAGTVHPPANDHPAPAVGQFRQRRVPPLLPAVILRVDQPHCGVEPQHERRAGEQVGLLLERRRPRHPHRPDADELPQAVGHHLPAQFGLVGVRHAQFIRHLNAQPPAGHLRQRPVPGVERIERAGEYCWGPKGARRV